MIVADIVRSARTPIFPSPVAPFVWAMAIRQYSYASFWTTTFGAPDDSSNIRTSVRQVVRDSLNSLLEADSYDDLLLQSEAFFFDDTNQILYIHTNLSYSPFSSVYEYGYSFGVSSEEVIDIGGYEYLPLIESVPSIEQEADAVGASDPKGVAGTIVLRNEAHINPVTGAREGILDFILDEKVYGNDVIISDYHDGVLTNLACLYIENFSVSLTECRLDLQDKRKRLELEVPTKTFTSSEYSKISDSDVGKVIPALYGHVATVELTCVNSDDSAKQAQYRLPDGYASCGSVQVEVDDVWKATTSYTVDLESRILTLSGGRNTSGSPRKVKLIDALGYNVSGSCTPRMIIEHLMLTYLNVVYSESNYVTSEWEAESALVDAEVGILLDDTEQLSKLIFRVSCGGAGSLRVYYAGDGRITAKAKSYARASSRVLASCDLLNAASLQIETQDKAYSGVKLRFKHSYADDTDIECTDETYKADVLRDYRQVNTLEVDTLLWDEDDAKDRAHSEATTVSTVPLIAKIEIAENLDLEIFDVVTVALMPDNLDSSAREFAGNQDALVLSVNPDIEKRVNSVSVQILPDRTPVESQAAVSSSGYTTIPRDASTIEILQQQIELASVIAESASESVTAITEVPADITELTATATQESVVLVPLLPSSSTQSPVAQIVQRSKDSGTTWFDTDGEEDGEALVPMGVYAWAFDRTADGYPEAADFLTWRFRIKIVNAAGVASLNWFEVAIIDVSGYKTWIPPKIVSLALTSSMRTVSIKHEVPVVYGLTRYEWQISKDGSTWYAPGCPSGQTPYTSEDNWRTSATADLDSDTSVPQWTQMLPLEGQSDGRPVDTTYLYRVRAVSDSGSVGTWSDNITALATATAAADIVESFLANAYASVDGIMAAYSGKRLNEYPDNPSGTANIWDFLKSSSYSGITGVQGTTLSVANGYLVATKASSNYAAMSISLPSGSVIRGKIKKENSTGVVFLYTTDVVNLTVIDAGEFYIFDGIIPSGDNNVLYIQTAVGPVYIAWLYIGDGTYLTGALSDLTGNGYNCNVYGSTPNGEAIVRDGVNDYEITVSSFAVPDRFWYHEEIQSYNNTSTYQDIFSAYAGYSTGRLSIRRNASSTTLRLVFSNGTGAVIYDVADFFPSVDNTKVVLDADVDFISQILHVYKNGLLFFTQALTSVIQVQSVQWLFGAQSGGYTKGSFSHRRLFNIIPTAAQVLELYQNPNAGVPSVVAAEKVVARNLAAIHGNLSVISGGVDDDNNRWVMSEYSGRTSNRPVGWFRVGSSGVFERIDPNAAGTEADPYIALEAGSEYIRLTSSGIIFSSILLDRIFSNDLNLTGSLSMYTGDPSSPVSGDLKTVLSSNSIKLYKYTTSWVLISTPLQFTDYGIIFGETPHLSKLGLYHQDRIEGKSQTPATLLSALFANKDVSLETYPWAISGVIRDNTNSRSYIATALQMFHSGALGSGVYIYGMDLSGNTYRIQLHNNLGHTSTINEGSSLTVSSVSYSLCFY